MGMTTLSGWDGTLDRANLALDNYKRLIGMRNEVVSILSKARVNHFKERRGASWYMTSIPLVATVSSPYHGEESGPIIIKEWSRVCF